MMTTRTGGFPIGFRKGWSDWQKDVPGLIEWTKANGLGVVDLGSDPEEMRAIAEAGLTIGSADLKRWKDLLSPDRAKREDAAAENAAHVEACAAHGVRNFFIVMLPEDPARTRLENFGYMVEGVGPLLPALERAHARIVIEGWPGPGALCCTPEGYRAAFRELPSPAMGVNYDPSHLLRMGIDPLRFVREFAERVGHVHGKDTEVFEEARYEYGWEQPPTFAKGHGFGETHWRYTIPGHGATPWTRVFETLLDAGYKGAVSIELEDENFNGSEAGEKAGLLFGARFLESA